VSFVPFLYLKGKKTLKNRSNDLLRPIFCTFYLIFAFFAIFALFRTFLVIFFLPFKASDEKVGGVLLFLNERGLLPP
jgi:hypothetical protein